MKQIIPFETGYRTTTAGPLWTTRDGKILWLTGGPVFPQKGLFSMYRVEMRESVDDGLSWSQPSPLLPSTEEYAWIANAGLTLASGRLLLISGQFGGYVDHDPEQSRMEGYSQFSDDDGRTWSHAIPLPTGQRYLAPPLSMAQLSSGRVIYPYGYLTSHQGRSLVSAVYSDDMGESWRRSSSVLGVGGKGMESGALEPTCVELPDGRVWMLIRAQTGFQWESFSRDHGETWSDPQPSRIPSSNSPAVLKKLSDGTILLLWNNCVSGVYARPSLMLAATRDGTHFHGFREIDHLDWQMSSAANQLGVMYPYVTQAADGTILVAYNYGDWTFLKPKLAKIDPAWWNEKNIDYDFGKYGIGDWCVFGLSDPAGSVTPVPSEKEGCYAMQVRHTHGQAGAVHNFPNMTEGKITFSLVLAKPQCAVLLHDSFLYPHDMEEACFRLRCMDDGTISLGTGTPETKEDYNSNLDQTPMYSYRAYPVKNDVPYPRKATTGIPFRVAITCSLSRKEASIMIDEGPAVTLPLTNILGLCYLSVKACDGGAVTISRLRWEASL